jgi:hypothetical protein
MDDTERTPIPSFLMIKSLTSLKNSLATAGVMAFTYAQSAFAQSFAGPSPNVGGLPDASSENEVRQIIVDIIAAVLNFLALIAVIVIIIAGIRLIVSQGEDEQKDKAKKTILYAIIGLVVVLFARIIVSLVTVYLFNQVNNP